MRIYTVGYGGRTKENFQKLLADNGVSCVADVRLRPDRARMGVYKFCGHPDKGIEKTCLDAGVPYRSFAELGNPFKDDDGWPEKFAALLGEKGHEMTRRLAALPGGFALLCAEKLPERCHRTQIADWLAREWGAEVVHLV